MPHVTISREQLYDEVWSQPMMRLAKSYGLSDVGLAKLCKRFDIPRPPRGHWAKLQAGQSPRRIPLPAREGTSEIVLHPAEEDQLKESGLADELQELTQKETQHEAQIVVSSNLRGMHTLVGLAREEFEPAKRNESGLLVIAGKPSLNIAVSRDQLRRSLLILDALLKAIEQRGYPVTVGPTVKIFEESISFGIKEALATQEEQPKEHDLSGPYEFGYSRFIKKLVPTGNLTLFIHEADHYWASGCRKQWRDGKKHKLEDVLNRVVAGLIDVAARKREHAIAMEQKRVAEAEAAKKRHEAAQRRAELAAKQAAERSRLEELLKQADSFRKSQSIRELVDAVRTASHSSDGQFDNWIAWALMHADRLDPTKESPRCILDEKLPEEPRGW